ncbi:hypothetical protein [Desulfofalx alkaliphila]|uniref:hypothetical protein n=1 Tax=Desulfofalx alkaliphila TaxID=105483 RepID=UPI0004E1DD6D|nr:hypothetical protein [Desulfofalx alkaliphila]
MKYRLTPRERVLLTVLLGLVVSYVVCGRWLGPQLKEYIGLSRQIKHTAEQLEEARAVVFSLPAKRDAAGQYYIKDMRDGNLFVAMDNAANDHQVNIVRLTAQAVGENSGYPEMPFEVVVRGNYSQVLSYLEWLENSYPWGSCSSISRFTVTPAPSSDTEEVDIILTLIFYSHPQPTGQVQIQYHNLHNNLQNGGQ